MAGHARFRRRQTCKSTRFDRSMTIPAVNAELINVMPMTKRYFLGPYLMLSGNIGSRAEVENHTQNCCKKERPTNDARLKPRIGGGGKNLRHSNSFYCSLFMYLDKHTNIAHENRKQQLFTIYGVVVKVNIISHFRF